MNLQATNFSQFFTSFPVHIGYKKRALGNAVGAFVFLLSPLFTQSFFFFLAFYFVSRYSRSTHNVVIVLGEHSLYSAIHIHVSFFPKPSPIQAATQH